ncbi:hypothetical protein [Bacillus pumilus]|uniref:hypothetical protein n=1 Tax=Bacillus pumilus TaxID=1408 RepID=UPI003D7460E6
MKGKKILFFMLVVISVIFVISNIYFGAKSDGNNFNRQLSEEIKAKDNEISHLKKEIKNAKPSEQERERRSILAITQRFIELSYVQSKDGYEERKKEAEKIMASDLLERFYPSDRFYQDHVSSNVKNINTYLKTKQNTENSIDAIAEFDHILSEEQNGTTVNTKIYVNVSIKKTKQGWVVNDLKDIYSLEE